MKVFGVAVGLVLLGLGGLDASFGQEKAAQPESVLCDKSYKAVSPDDGREVGSYRLKAVSTEGGQKVQITESVSLDYRGKKAGYTSVVTYKVASPPVPEHGTTETSVDGKVCMKGSVTISGTSISHECTGVADKAGQPINPPRRFVENYVLKPAGILVFQSAFLVLAPRFLPQAGELKDVVFVEFPDDIAAPELINLKSGYRLVREPADDKGEYEVKVFSPGSEQSVRSARFNKDGQLVSISAFGNVKLVEADGAGK